MSPAQLQILTALAYIIVWRCFGYNSSAATSSLLQNNSPKSIYISFIRPANSTLTSRGMTPLETVLQVDDSPFQQIEIPWAFDFFGRKVNRLFVNPNGALHVSQTAPCGDCDCFASSSCSFNTSYSGLIAGYLTDLNPSASTFGNVTFSLAEKNHLVVSFSRIQLFDNPYNVSFSIDISRDGSIRIDYSYIFPNLAILPNFKGFGAWLSGLRPPQWGGSYLLTSRQRSTGLNPWRTSSPGVYPTTTELNGLQFTACPLSSVWCVSPRLVNVSDSSSTVTVLTVTPLSWSCVDEVEFAISISPSVGVLNLSLVDCEVSGNASSLLCDISTFAATANNFQQFVSIAWRPRGQSISFEYLSVDPIGIYILNSFTRGAASEATIRSILSDNCSSNVNSTLCEGAVCPFCSGNLSCLHLVCPSDLDQPRCGNSCSDRLYYDDINNVCCNATAADCTGTCNGSARIAKDDDSTPTCCSEIVDCNGVCGGPAARDACGTCGGKDFQGKGCQLDILFSTGAKTPNALFTTIDLKSRTKSSSNNITVTNLNSSALSVTIYEPTQAPTDAPTLNWWPKNTVVIEANSSFVFYLNVNLSGLDSGKQTSWAVKTIVLECVRATSHATINYPISVYPSVTGCGLIASQDHCARMPGCTVCLAYNNIRLLSRRNVAGKEMSSWEMTREAYAKENRYAIDLLAEDEDLLEQKARRRSLFSYYLQFPSFSNPSNLIKQISDSSHCVETWDPADCSATAQKILQNGSCSIHRWNSLINFSLAIVLVITTLLCF